MSIKGVVLLLIVWLGLIFCALTVRAEIEGIDGVTFSPPNPLTSYGYKDKSNWTGWNKFWFGSAIALYGVGDTWSTVDALKGDNCHEANPLFGEDPSTGVLIAGKVAAFGLAWWLTEYVYKDKPGARNVIYGAMSIIGGAVTYHNTSLNCD